ncbi:HAMP linker domain protein, partial [Candidatus Magnetoovum chiemensis]
MVCYLFYYGYNAAISLIVIGLLLALILSSWIITSITKPLSQFIHDVDRVADGDLTVSIKCNRADELGDLGKSIKRMVARLFETIRAIQSSTNNVLHAVETLKAMSEKTTHGAQEQASQADQISTAAEEMSQTILSITKNASSASDKSSETMSIVVKGKDIAKGAVDTISTV